MPQDVADAAALAPRVLAADGGATLALEAGVVPEAVIGDFDSFPNDLRSKIPADRLHRVAEQDSTDFEKSMARIAAPVVVGVGFTGARIDHQLAVLHGMLKFRHRPCVLLGTREIVFLCPPKFACAVPAGATVSLFPMALVRGTSAGLEWPIAGLTLAPGEMIGTSNRATGDRITLDVDGPALLVILPRTALTSVVQALLALPARTGLWPAP